MPLFMDRNDCFCSPGCKLYDYMSQAFYLSATVASAEATTNYQDDADHGLQVY